MWGMEERDHKKLGPELELFYIDQEVGKGLPMFLPKGATLKRELERFVIEEELKRGYLHWMRLQASQTVARSWRHYWIQKN